MLHKDLLDRLATARSLLEVVPDRKSVASVASSIGMSEFHFIRLFASVFGETPGHFAIRSRLVQARTLLKETDDTITDIAISLGYQSVGSFSNLFKDRFGITPGHYRSATAMRKGTNTVPDNLLHGCVSLMCGIKEGNIQ